MKILGVGIDIQDIAPFQSHLDDQNDAFFARVFSEDEIEYCKAKKNPAQHFAARFCAKEACVKALPEAKLLITDVSVCSGNPAPSLLVNFRNLKASKSWDTCRFMVSLSHTQNYAVAHVLVVEASAS